MKTKFLKIGLTVALIVIMGGGLLFGTIKMIDATQAEIPACMEQNKTPCTLDAVK